MHDRRLHGRRGRGRIDSAEDEARCSIDPRRHDWYVLRTASQRERLTRLLLADQGLPAWTPLEHRVRRASRYTRRRVRRRYPLLVGYVLVGLPSDRDRAAHAIVSALRLRTVTGIVTVDGNPARLDHRAVERLILVDSGDMMVAPKPGDRLRLTDGALAGVHVAGELVELREIRGTQARVLTSLFGGVEATVPLERLQWP